MNKQSILDRRDWLRPQQPEKWYAPFSAPINWSQSKPEEPSAEERVEWKPRAIAKVVACQVTGFEGSEAVCTVYLEGYELSRVGFPAAVLRRKSLDVGSWFGWVMRDTNLVQSGDILPKGPLVTGLSPGEIADLEAKSEAAIRRHVARGPLPEYTGDGD